MTDSFRSHDEIDRLRQYAAALEGERAGLTRHCANLESQIEAARVHTGNLEQQVKRVLEHAANLEHDIEKQIDFVIAAERESQRSEQRAADLHNVNSELAEKLTAAETELRRLQSGWRGWRLGLRRLRKKLRP